MRNKQKLINEIARQLYHFNSENKKYKVSDIFVVDGKKYSVTDTMLKWFKSAGYGNLYKLLVIPRKHK